MRRYTLRICPRYTQNYLDHAITNTSREDKANAGAIFFFPLASRRSETGKYKNIQINPLVVALRPLSDVTDAGDVIQGLSGIQPYL